MSITHVFTKRFLSGLSIMLHTFPIYLAWSRCRENMLTWHRKQHITDTNTHLQFRLYSTRTYTHEDACSTRKPLLDTRNASTLSILNDFNIWVREFTQTTNRFYGFSICHVYVSDITQLSTETYVVRVFQLHEILTPKAEVFLIWSMSSAKKNICCWFSWYNASLIMVLHPYTDVPECTSKNAFWN